MKPEDCPKLNQCQKIDMILDKDLLDFQYAEAKQRVCGRCSERNTAGEGGAGKGIDEGDFAFHHLCQAYRALLAELDGRGELARRLYAEMRFRLINMPDQQLWELVRLTSHAPEWPIEATHRMFIGAIEKSRLTASEWVKDLKLSSNEDQGKEAAK